MYSSFDDYFGRELYEKSDTSILLPWVGSKRSLLSQLESYYPKSFNNYYEPFCGSLSVGSDVISKFGKGHGTYAFNDYNTTLINLYSTLSSEYGYKDIVEALEQLFEEVSSLEDEDQKEQFYLERRKEFNSNLDSDSTRQSALFYFLIKTSFQQMCRFNSRGEFNAPFGRGKAFNMDYDKLESFHDKFKDAVFSSGDFEKFIRSQNPHKGDFIYFDPPYDDTFTGYTSANFKSFDQERLANLVKELVTKGCYCLISNSRTNLIESLYSDFNIVDITRNNKWQRVGNDKNKKNLECLIIATNISKNILY